jgi:hypothetical protein
VDALQITTDEKRLPVKRDGKDVGELVFNPADILFAEKFYKIVGEFETKTGEFQSRSDAIEADGGMDAHGLPLNAPARLALLRETCEFVRGRIDYLFGEGTALMVFGEAMSLDAFSQFFSGITPYIKTTRAEKIAQYIPPAKNGKRRTRK